jgi:hypothetical protein
VAVGLPHARLLALALVVLTVGWSRPALTQPLDEAELETRDTAAKRACDAGQVQEGERLLTELFHRTDDGTYIFNLGRCYHQNGQTDKALLQYRAYLLRSDVDPAAATRARESIAALEPPPPPATAPAAGPAAPAPIAADPALVPPVTSLAASATPPAPGRTMRIVGLVSGGIGVAGLVTGAAYALQTSKLENQKREALERQNQSVEWFIDQDKKGERAERLQWVFLGAGGAALAAGGVLYYLGTRADQEQRQEQKSNATLPSARALPLALPGVVGAVIAGRF